MKIVLLVFLLLFISCHKPVNKIAKVEPEQSTCTCDVVVGPIGPKGAKGEDGVDGKDTVVEVKNLYLYGEYDCVSIETESRSSGYYIQLLSKTSATSTRFKIFRDSDCNDSDYGTLDSPMTLMMGVSPLMLSVFGKGTGRSARVFLLNIP